MAQRTAPATFRKAARIPVSRDQLLNTIEVLIDPMALVLSLWVVTLLFEGYLAPRYVILSLAVFSLTFPGATLLNTSVLRVIRHVLLSWLVIDRIGIWEAAAHPASLEVVLWGALAVLPFILAYNVLAYWIFRGKAKEKLYD